MPWSLKQAPEAFCDVAVEIAQSDGMAEHTAATLFDSTCGFDEPMALNFLQDDPAAHSG